MNKAAFWKAFERSKAFYKTASVISCSTIISVLFILAMVDCFVPEPPFYAKEKHDPSRLTPYENSSQLRESLYPGRTLNEISSLLSGGKEATHPFLLFMAQPRRTRFYNIGIEGVRSDSTVPVDRISKVIAHSTWVFGGSTTFGVGVADDETVSANLNHLNPENTYLNFGVPGYNQNLELAKLVVLLKKGYHPKRVVFIDGLNDVSTLASQNFHPAETAWRPFPHGSREDEWFPLRPVATLRRWLLTFSHSTDGQPATPDGYDDIYASEDHNLYLRDPDRYLLALHRKIRLPSSRIKDKVSQYYRANLELLDILAHAYKFDYFIFFQPMGFLASGSPLSNHEVLGNRGTAIETARAMIASGQLKNFFDISDLGNECADCYVDRVHYSAKFSTTVARRILGFLQAR